MSDIDREAFERIERQFTSSNSVPVERASVRKEDWDAVKRYMRAARSQGEEAVVPEFLIDALAFYAKCSHMTSPVENGAVALDAVRRAATLTARDEPTKAGVGVMSEFKKYRRKGFSEMRPYVPGEDLTGVSVSAEDNPEDDRGMIARNPKNHADQWYVARQYFDDNLEEVGPCDA